MRDNKAVATAVGWQLLFILRKATEAELTAEVKVNLNADSCSSESEACECERMICIIVYYCYFFKLN